MHVRAKRIGEKRDGKLDRGKSVPLIRRNELVSNSVRFFITLLGEKSFYVNSPVSLAMLFLQHSSIKCFPEKCSSDDGKILQIV